LDWFDPESDLHHLNCIRYSKLSLQSAAYSFSFQHYRLCPESEKLDPETERERKREKERERERVIKRKVKTGTGIPAAETITTSAPRNS